EEIRKAEELDPLAFITIDRGAEIRMLAGRYAEGLNMNLRAAKLRSEPFLRNLGDRAELLTLLGQHKEAVEVARAIRKNRSPQTRFATDASAVWTLAKAGLEKEAAEYADELKTKPGGDSYVRGFVLVALGRFEQALPFLAHMPSGRIHLLYWDPL